MYALHCGLLPLNTSRPLSVTTCHISAPPLLYLSRAAGLSRLSCVTDFRIATAFYPCGGRAPSNRPGLVCLLAVPPIDALPTCAVSFRGESPPAGMVPEFRPERHLFPQCEAVLGFTQTCQKRSVPMSFRDRGHAQLHPLVAGFRPPRPRLSGVPVWGERRVSGRPESNRPSVEKGPTQRACGRSSDRIQAPVGCRVIRHTAQGRFYVRFLYARVAAAFSSSCFRASAWRFARTRRIAANSMAFIRLARSSSVMSG